MRYYFIILCALAICCTGQAQQLKRDSILLFERAIDRPLTLHKGQLRLTGHHALTLFNKRFDANGNKIRLSDEGLTKVRYSLLFEIKYGLNDFVQFNAQIAKQTETQRGKEYVIIAESENYSIHNIMETKGLNDLTVSTDIRAPFKTKKIEVVGILGATLPTAKSVASRPDHTVERTTDGNSTSYNLTYHNINHWGNGVPIMITGLRGKFRGEKWAINGNVEYRHPTKQSQGKNWIYQLYGSSFEYKSVDYTYQIHDQLFTSLEVEHQALPWLDTFLGLNLVHSTGGWSAITNQKVAMGKAQFFSIHGGLEILITHKLWLKETFTIAASGKNTFAPFTLFTTIHYNLFP